MTHTKLNIRFNNILPVFGVDPILGKADQGLKQSPLDPPITGYPAIITLFSPNQNHKNSQKLNTTLESYLK